MFNIKKLFGLLLCEWAFLHLGGGGGSTSSSSAQDTQTTNTDKRIAASNSVVAQDGSAINYTGYSVDPEIAKSAFDFAKSANTVNGDGFTKLLDTVDRLTTKTSDSATSMSSRFQDNIMQAYDQAKAAAAGGIDQKTMIVLGIAAAASLAIIKGKK